MQRLIHGLTIGAVVCATIALPQASGAMRDKNEKTVTVGGAAMFPSKDIIDNAVNSKDHTTLVAAVKAAEKGGKATITIPNVYQSNGVIHVISAVVMPS